MNTITWQSNMNEENGRRKYIPSSWKMRNNIVMLSAIARQRSNIMKTDFFIREPYVITMMMRLFSTIPILVNPTDTIVKMKGFRLSLLFVVFSFDEKWSCDV